MFLSLSVKEIWTHQVIIETKGVFVEGQRVIVTEEGKETITVREQGIGHQLSSGKNGHISAKFYKASTSGAFLPSLESNMSNIINLTKPVTY
jgi:hypothetical protein